MPMAIPGKYALVYVQNDDAPIEANDEPMSTTDNLVFSIDDRNKRHWSRDFPVVVEEESSPGVWDVVDVGRYRVQHAGGRIHFHETQPLDVRVSMYYVTVSVAAGANDYSVTIGSEMIDTTEFASGGWRERMAGLVDATGSIGGFYLVNNFYQDRILQQESLVLEFYADQRETEVLSFYAYLESKELAAAVEGAVGTSISWQSDGDILVDQVPA